jgi:hypothetical protein
MVDAFRHQRQCPIRAMLSQGLIGRLRQAVRGSFEQGIPASVGLNLSQD